MKGPRKEALPMNPRWIHATLTVLVALAVSSPALAFWPFQKGKITPQTVRPPVYSLPDSTGVEAAGTDLGGGMGAAQTDDIARDRDWVLFAPNVIQNNPPNSPWSGGADSSGAIPTAGWLNMKLRIYARPDADSTFKALLAISWHGSAIAATDTATAARPIDLMDAAAANAWAADTLGYRQYVASTNDTTYRTSAQPGEQILVVMSRADGRYWYEIPLADRQGRWFTSDYTWLRVRVLYVYNSIGNRHPIGGPPVQQFRCDLVGRR